MPGFGRFETVEELASSGPFAVYSARPAGESGPPAFAIKVYRTNDMFADADVIEREAAAFLEAAKLQQSLPSGGLDSADGHWARIIELGRTEEAAYYVTDLYPASGQRMIDGRREMDARGLAWIIGGVVDALAELGKKANGRGHGGLTPSNVLVAVKEELEGSPVALTDPEPDSRLDPRSQGQDLKDLAGLLFQLVTHRPAPKGGEVRTSAEWQRLGAAGEQLRLLCEALLNPQPGAPLLTFEQIKQKLAATLAVKEKKKGGLPLGAKLGIAAVLVLGIGAGVYFGVIHKAGPPPDPITPDWMVAQVQTVSGKLAAAQKKASENTDEEHEKEAGDLEGKLKAAQARIDAVRKHDPPQSEAELRSLVAKKTDAETDLADLEKRIDTLSTAIVVLDPEQDPRRPDPEHWMVAPLAELNGLMQVVEKDTPTEGEGPPDVGALKQSLQGFAAKLDEQRAKPWPTPDTEPAARKQAQTEIRNAVKDAAAEQKTLKATLTKSKGQARERLEKYLSDQRELARTDKLVTSDALREAYAIGIGTINLGDQSLGWEQVKGKVAELTNWLKGLEAGLPAGLDVQPQPGSGLDLKPAEEAIKKRRERALVQAVEPMTGGRTLPAAGDAAYAAKWGKIRDDYLASVSGVKQILADAAAIERLLSLGYGYEEQEGSASIKSLRTEIEGHASYGEVRASVDSVLARASDLEQVTNATDGARLMGLITSAGQNVSAGSVSPLMAAWKKLPKAGFPVTPGDLDRAGELLNSAIMPALEKVPDSARRTELQNQARDAAKDMWFTYVHEGTGGKPDAVGVAFAARTKFGVADADLAKLEPWATYDLERWNLMNSVATVKDPDPQKQLDAIQPMVVAFLSKIAAMKSLPERDAMKGMASRLKPYAEHKDLDLTREGPGRVSGVATTAGDEDGQIVFYAWRAKSGKEYRLEFRRVLEAPDAASYLCTTDVSLGLCIDLMESLGKWEDLRSLTNQSDPDNDSRRGPRVSAWTREGKMDLSRPTNPDKTGLGWHRAVTTDDMLRNPYYPAGGAPAKGPEFEDPVDFISPAGAAYVSRLLNCRLPSSAEWKAADARFPTANPNLRDQTWAAQHAYILGIMNAANKQADLPNQSMLKPKGFVKPAEQDGAPAVDGNDQVLYFAHVDQGGDGKGPDGAPVFHHLVGNVWEFVFENPEAMNGSPFPPTKEGINAVMGRGEQVRAIGASAISPKDFPPATAVEFNWTSSKSGFADAGFRLAFSTGAGTGGTGKPAERLARLLSTTDYLTRTTK